MPHTSKRTRRHILGFAAAILFAAVSNILMPEIVPLSYTATLMYCAVLTAWILTVQKRVIQWHIRRYLIAAAGACALLFVLRVCRWNFFAYSATADRYLRYIYYVPVTIAPLCVFSAAQCVGRRWRDKPLRYVRWLWIPCAAIVLGFLTNDLHGAALRITAKSDGSYSYSHGWLYLVMAAWTAALLLWSFGTLLHRCRVLGCKRFWAIPVAWAAVFTVLIVTYLIHGGSFYLWGSNLYNFQEVWSALIVGTAECFIQIGLIPSNNDYEEIFQKSHWDMALADRDGNIVYHSADAFVPERAQTVAALRESVAIDDGHILHAREIPGGISTWLVDRTRVNKTNEQLAEAVEYLEEENDLLAEENRVCAERAAYETQNRLYDGVIPIVQPQLSEAERLLREDTEDDAAYRANMLRAMVLCDYAKRRINLSLIAHEKLVLSSDELVLAIRETLEYLSAGEIETAVECRGGAPFPTEQLMMTYDFFETVLEAALPALGALFVHIETRGALQLKCVMETPSALPPEDWLARQRQKLGAELELCREDEGSAFARLSFGKEAAGE